VDATTGAVCKRNSDRPYAGTKFFARNRGKFVMSNGKLITGWIGKRGMQVKSPADNFNPVGIPFARTS
jgi:hypothetical protein